MKITLLIIALFFIKIIQCIFLKKAGIKYTGAETNILLNIIACVFAMAFSIIICFFTRKTLFIENKSIILMISCGIALGICLYSSVKVFICGASVAISYLFINASVIIPIISSIFIYSESVSILQYIAIALFIVAGYFLGSTNNIKNKKYSFKTWIWLFLSFLSNGYISLGQKFFQTIILQ